MFCSFVTINTLKGDTLFPELSTETHGSADILSPFQPTPHPHEYLPYILNTTSHKNAVEKTTKPAVTFHLHTMFY